MDLITLATSLQPDTSVAFTATVIIAGLGIVLATLAVLIVVFYAFGSVVSKAEGSSKKKAQKKNAENKISQPKTENSAAKVTSAVSAAAPAVQDGISGEVVAAISAAVYAIEGADASISAITPVRNTKKNPITGRNPWAQAAVIENTKPF